MRSESNTIKTSYEEARKHIANYNLAAATEICDKWLAKYPGHALFQALIFDIDGARRQQLSTDIARIDGELEKEFDLDRRVQIIEAGVARHPGEGHFEKLLKAATAKREIVNGIVAKARSFEERGAYADALTQWEILRSVASQYPGIDIEIDRVVKRREQKARAETKANWISQIDAILDKGDSNKALALVREAMLEFPDDPELQPLEQLAQQGIERAGEADTLLEQATEMTRQNRFEEGLEVLRRAHRLDQGNARVRGALLDVLVTQASTEARPRLVGRRGSGSRSGSARCDERSLAKLAISARRPQARSGGVAAFIERARSRSAATSITRWRKSNRGFSLIRKSPG